MNNDGMITADMMESMATMAASFGVWWMIRTGDGEFRTNGGREAYSSDYLVYNTACNNYTRQGSYERNLHITPWLINLVMERDSRGSS